MTENLTTVPVHQALPAPVPQPGQLAVADLMRQDQLIQQVIREAMVPGYHYGTIPGTEARDGDKPRPPVLLKPGAEKLCMLFRLAPTFHVQTKELPGGHREERVTCTLTHIASGAVLASALGSCSTMEAKYRYRNTKPRCPKCGAEQINRSKKEPGFYCWAKKGGCGATFGPHDSAITSQAIGLTENRDLADQYNTVLKMAVKRAHIAATLLATAASDAFIPEDDTESEERDDHGESEEPRQQRGRAAAAPAKKEAAEPQLSPKQQIAHECAKLVSLLDWTVEEVRMALAEHGIAEKFERWSQLDEAQLERARKMFEAALKAGAPVEAQK